MNIDTIWTAEEYDAVVKGAINFILHRPLDEANIIRETPP